MNWVRCAADKPEMEATSSSNIDVTSITTALESLFSAAIGNDRRIGAKVLAAIEREIGSVFRAVAVKVAEGQTIPVFEGMA